MSADELAAAVAELGALPVPAGPEPQASESPTLAGYKRAYADAVATVARQSKKIAELERIADAERARVAELEAERKKYVGAEPTIAEEMAYLSRCIDSVLDLCSEAESKGITSGGPFTVEAVRKAADGLVERASYPPAFPWARLMDDEDRAEFLDELAESATTHASSDVVLAEVEETCKTWRLIAEAQHGHNTAPGPDAVTAVFVPVASLREPEGEFYGALHHDYRPDLGRDLPETGGTS